MHHRPYPAAMIGQTIVCLVCPVCPSEVWIRFRRVMFTLLSYFLVCTKAESCCVDINSKFTTNLAENEFRSPRRCIGELQAIAVSWIILSVHICVCDMLSSECRRLYSFLNIITDPIKPADLSVVVFLLIMKVRRTTPHSPHPEGTRQDYRSQLS